MKKNPLTHETTKMLDAIANYVEMRMLHDLPASHFTNSGMFLTVILRYKRLPDGLIIYTKTFDGETNLSIIFNEKQGLLHFKRESNRRTVLPSQQKFYDGLSQISLPLTSIDTVLRETIEIIIQYT